MWEEKGYIYAIYDFLDFNRVDLILVDFTKMGIHVADCSGSYDASFGTENEQELIEDSKVVILFLTKQTGISHRLISQLDVARRNEKKIIAIMLDPLKEMSIPEDIVNFIQGQPKIKAYDYETYYAFLRAAKGMVKNYIQKSETNQVLDRVLRIGVVGMILVLVFVTGKFLYTRQIIHTLKEASVKVCVVKTDGSQVVYNGVFIDKDGIILTDAKAVEESKELWIESGTEKMEYNTTVVFSEQEQGIALLATNAKCESYIPYTGTDLKGKEKIYTTTYADGKNEPDVYDGTIIKNEGEEKQEEYEIEITGNVTFPYSGSPVIDKHGKIVGILCYTSQNKTTNIFFDLEALKSLSESNSSEIEGNGLSE